MKTIARWIALATLGLLALVAASPGLAGAAGETSTPRSIAYFASYNQEHLGMLIEAGKKGYVTHVNMEFFHLEWRDRAKKTGPCIGYNGLYLDDPRLAPIWETIEILRGLNVKVLATFGGWAVKDYGQLLDSTNPNAAIWYEELKSVLTTHHFDGLDMDIEEDYRETGHQAVVTTNLRTLLENLRRDLGDGFLLTSTPVAGDLMDHRSTVSPGIDYRTLMLEGWFDWYNLQFYNGFGDIWGAGGAPDYDAVLRHNPHIPASKLVAIVLTNPLAGTDGYYELSSLTQKYTQLARKHWDFGGAAGWTFVEAQVNRESAPVNQTDPVGWAKAISRALNSKDLSPLYLLLLED
jgi:hypothetical protein